MSNLKVTLPNGMVLSGFGSEGQVIRVANGIGAKEAKTQTESKIIKFKSAGAKKKKCTNIRWSPQELSFLVENIENKASFFQASFLANRHSKNGINVRYSNTKSYLKNGVVKKNINLGEATYEALDEIRDRVKAKVLREDEPYLSGFRD